ncbi:MAG: sugar porter family MFS transporter [Stappiaceae bacterium]
MLLRLTIVAALCGFLFGFDEGVISGALPYLQRVFSFSSTWEGLMTAAVPLGAAGGALVGALMSDRYGRRLLLIGSAVLFVFGSVLSSVSFNIGMLTGARLIIGAAIGCSTLVAPQYLSELAPADVRGRVVATFQLMINIGILCSYLSDLTLVSLDMGTLSGDNVVWRLMFLVAIAPAILMLVGIRTAPESPRWLVMKGRSDAAASVLSGVQPALPKAEIDRMVGEMVADDREWQEEVGWSHLFAPNIRHVTLFAMIAFFFQQVSGINVVIYYAPEIMKNLGFQAVTAQLSATVGIGVILVCSTAFSMLLVDRLGRRPLLIVGFIGAAMCLATIAYVMGSSSKSDDIVALYALCIFIFFFSISIGPLPWIYMSELFPTELRGRGMALAVLTNWAMTFLVVFLFPVVSGSLGLVATFAIFAGFCGLGVLFAFKFAPETKGIPLEELQVSLGTE